MQNWKKALLPALVAFGLSGPAFAGAVYIDTSPAGGTEPIATLGTVTDPWNQYQLFANTSTIQFDTNLSGTLNAGDKFTDSGNAIFTSQIPSGYQAGINLGLGGGVVWSEITITWSGLTGTTLSIDPVGSGGFTTTTSYDAGTVFNFYYEQPGNHDFGGGAGSGDDTGFGDGTLVLQLALTGGTGSNLFDSSGEFVEGSSLLFGEVIYALDSFWFFENGDLDFEDLINQAFPIQITSRVDQNTDNAEFIPLAGVCPPGLEVPTGTVCLFQVDSDHDGSISFAVPEPGTLALLGLALLGMGAGRRRVMKA